MHIKPDSSNYAIVLLMLAFKVHMTRNTDNLSQGTELISFNSSSRNVPTESTPEDDYNAWKEASDDLNVTRSIIASAENGGMSESAVDSLRERASVVQQTVDHYETEIPSLKKS